MAIDHAVDEAAIRDQINRLVAGIQAMDLEQVTSIYAPDIVSFDVQPPLEVVGREAKSRNWVDAFGAFRQPIRYEIRNLEIEVDGELAFAHSLNRLNGMLKNGDRAGSWVRATACFRKVDGTWGSSRTTTSPCPSTHGPAEG